MKPIRCCVDRPLDGRRFPYAAMPMEFRWPAGMALKVRFLNGPDEVRQRIVPLAQQWSQHANIRFDFGDHPDAHIRVAIRDGQTHLDAGSWSYLGRIAVEIPEPQPTINFGWLTPDTDDDEYSRVVLHEFGHALGLIHEHQNPAVNVNWNEKAVYEYYAGAPNFWTPEDVDNNLFKPYASENTQFTTFDPKSIMLYPIPAEFTTDGFSVGWNRVLSATDIDFIRRMYPA